MKARRIICLLQFDKMASNASHELMHPGEEPLHKKQVKLEEAMQNNESAAMEFVCPVRGPPAAHTGPRCFDILICVASEQVRRCWTGVTSASALFLSDNSSVSAAYCLPCMVNSADIY